MNRTNMNIEQFQEELRRALLTEEEMAHELVSVCNPSAIENAVGKANAGQISEWLTSIRNDTARHADIIRGLIDSLKDAKLG